MKYLWPALTLTTFLFSTLAVQAKEESKDLPTPTEQVKKLDPMEVKTSPFAAWGIGCWGQINLVNKIWGGPPKNMFVITVYSGSPADLAGVKSGDEIKSINGVAIAALNWRDFSKHFQNTERGDIVSIELFDRAAYERRTTELKITSNKAWVPKGNFPDLNLWGLCIRTYKNIHANLEIDPRKERIERWKTVPVEQSRKSKNKNEEIKTKKKAVHVFRRIAELTWDKKKMVFIERPNGVVEFIEGDKVPESDDVVGRLVQEGATLTLNPDGTYELKDAPANPNSPLQENPTTAPNGSTS